MKFNIGQVLKEQLVGKIFVDSEFSDKGDYAYYEENGLEYPPFDCEISKVYIVHNGEDPLILIEVVDGQTHTFYTNDTIEVKEK